MSRRKDIMTSYRIVLTLIPLSSLSFGLPDALRVATEPSLSLMLRRRSALSLPTAWANSSSICRISSVSRFDCHHAQPTAARPTSTTT